MILSFPPLRLRFLLFQRRLFRSCYDGLFVTPELLLLLAPQAVSVSDAFARGVGVQDCLAAGDWSCARTFFRHYLQPLASVFSSEVFLTGRSELGSGKRKEKEEEGREVLATSLLSLLFLLSPYLPGRDECSCGLRYSFIHLLARQNKEQNSSPQNSS